MQTDVVEVQTRAGRGLYLRSRLSIINHPPARAGIPHVPILSEDTSTLAEWLQAVGYAWKALHLYHS